MATVKTAVDSLVQEIDAMHTDIRDRLGSAPSSIISDAHKDVVLHLVSVTHDRIKALLDGLKRSSGNREDALADLLPRLPPSILVKKGATTTAEKLSKKPKRVSFNI